MPGDVKEQEELDASSGFNHDPSALTEPRAAGIVRPSPALPLFIVIITVPLTLVILQLGLYLLAAEPSRWAPS